MNRDTSRKEALGIVLFFVAVINILMFYLPDRFTGIAGIAVRDFFFGLVGVVAYAIPAYILYVALDVFFEKRQGVSGIRVRTVILFMVSLSVLLALISMDMDYFEVLCIDSAGNASAVKALSILWTSGPESLMITNPAKSSVVLSGGIIGGSIAVALYEVTGKVVGVLTVIAFILTQFLLIFRVSIKATARNTAHVISAASAKVYNSVVSNRGYEKTGYRVYSGNGYSKDDDKKGIRYGAHTAVIPHDTTGADLPMAGSYPPFVIVNSQQPGMQGPFLTNMPIDGETGFTDIDKMTDGQILSGIHDPGKLAYRDNEYDITDGNDASADFGYTTDPLSVPGAASIKKKLGTPSFLDTNKPDFYDLSQDEKGKCDSVEEMQGMTEEPAGPSYDYSENDRQVRTPVIDRSFYEKLADTEDAGSAKQQAEHIEKTAVPGTPVVKRETDRQKKLKRLENYSPAPTRLLLPEKRQKVDKDLNTKLKDKAHQLEAVIASFGVNAKVINIIHGPRITRFEMTIETGVKVSRITNLQKDIMLAMAAKSINIEAPIPGKSAIGVEIPNEESATVYIRPLLESERFKNSTPLTVAIGRDISGAPIYCDIAKMPHLLIAGSTGSGKSVCLNSILTSILTHSSPFEVKMILVDPKRVEFIVYNGIPHLIMPVITDVMKAAGALNWALNEMQRRYKLFEEAQVRDINGYNVKFSNDPNAEHLPLILIVIDELADIMLVAAKEVEVYISRLAALARASGIHLIIATQRPSVNVITGSIKANIGSRIALATASNFDSRTILGRDGAEKLLGHGDMLYAPMSEPDPVRGQGAWVDEKEETLAIINYLKNNYGSMYDESIISDIDRLTAKGDQAAGEMADPSPSGSGDDELFEQAVMTVIENGSASTSLIQRRLGLGYPKAGRLIDELEKRKIIGPLEGSKPRKILITMTEWLEMKESFKQKRN